MGRGELFVLSAPSGAGKTTLIRSLMSGVLADFGRVEFSVSHTTRAPRQGEAHGRDYWFVSESEFQEMIAQDRFLEWAEVHGNYYGTSRQAVVPKLDEGLDVILDIDVKGAETVLSQQPEATGIFVMPPSYRALRERLERRRQDSPDEMRRRLAVSLWEIRRYRQYEFVIINDDARRASQALAAIILSRRQRTERTQARTERIVSEFEEAFAREHPDSP